MSYLLKLPMLQIATEQRGVPGPRNDTLEYGTRREGCEAVALFHRRSYDEYKLDAGSNLHTVLYVHTVQLLVQ